ncbi:unnamed protein product, partial [Amoebophrya sp. A25]
RILIIHLHIISLLSSSTWILLYYPLHISYLIPFFVPGRSSLFDTVPT